MNLIGSGTNEKMARDNIEANGRHTLMTKLTCACSGLSEVLQNKNRSANVEPAKQQDCGKIHYKITKKLPN